MISHFAFRIDMDTALPSIAAFTLVVGAVAGWALARAAARRDHADAAQLHQSALRAHRTVFAETARRLAEVQGDLQSTRDQLQDACKSSMAAREENAQLRTEITHQQQTIPEKVALIEKAQEH